MKQVQQFMAIIEGDDGYVAFCPELDIASQSLIHKSRPALSFCQYRVNSHLLRCFFVSNALKSAKTQPAFRMSSTYGSDS